MKKNGKKNTYFYLYTYFINFIYNYLSKAINAIFFLLILNESKNASF